MAYAMKNKCPFCGNNLVNIPCAESCSSKSPSGFSATCTDCGSSGPSATSVPQALSLWENGVKGYRNRCS